MCCTMVHRAVSSVIVEWQLIVWNKVEPSRYQSMVFPLVSLTVFLLLALHSNY